MSSMKTVQSTPQLAKTISKNLRTLISQHEPMVQQELALDIGIPTMVLNRTIRGESTPCVAAIINMAKYYEVSTDWILGQARPPRNGSKRKAG